MPANPQSALQRLVLRHCHQPRKATSLPNVTLFNCAQPTKPVRSLYEPRLCVVLQGRKRVMLGRTVHDAGPSQCLVATADLPVTASVTEARPDKPHLAVTLTLERLRVAEVWSTMPARPAPQGGACGLVTGALEQDLIDPVTRLLGILDRPQDATVLAPMIEREIIYRLLQGAFGPVLAGLASDPNLTQIDRATRWLRDHYHLPFRIDDLASRVGMSATSLHRHFKAITAMTPLEYRREIRLEEARRRILAGAARVGEVGIDVGYDSASQFSREYRRHFGRSPSEEAELAQSGNAVALPDL
ncbi:HTH araC/xylS-type domain-containing protein [Paraburkholderia unamae]|uniref:AraC family transcriptional regulator n=1 Tax=Paraburkholderia unamae TaxID=219649 RepID=UPI001CACFBCA|nr:AraC family transcriptional regulator [Paraburkholderia unamae]CAG9274457.1 HTH araC/xylS-type domain-containing protein [Paraburkholderia unamae]